MAFRIWMVWAYETPLSIIKSEHIKTNRTEKLPALFPTMSANCEAKWISEKEYDVVLDLDILHSLREAKTNAVKNRHILSEQAQNQDRRSRGIKSRTVKFCDKMPLANEHSTSLPIVGSCMSKSEGSASISTPNKTTNTCHFNYVKPEESYPIRKSAERNCGKSVAYCRSFSTGEKVCYSKPFAESEILDLFSVISALYMNKLDI